MVPCLPPVSRRKCTHEMHAMALAWLSCSTSAFHMAPHRLSSRRSAVTMCSQGGSSSRRQRGPLTDGSGLKPLGLQSSFKPLPESRRAQLPRLPPTLRLGVGVKVRVSRHSAMFGRGFQAAPTPLSQHLIRVRALQQVQHGLRGLRPRRRRHDHCERTGYRDTKPWPAGAPGSG